MSLPSFITEQVIEQIKHEPFRVKPFYDAVVRIVDIFVSTMVLIVSMPLIAAVAVAIYLEDHGPVFFRQRRLGKGGEPFYIRKFRSMKVNAENEGDRLQMTKNDSRITRIGLKLREYHIDEIPQIIDVLFGKMSLVGPRPALCFQKDYYESWELVRLKVTPGITGLSQVYGGNTINWDERILIDVYFVHRRNIYLYLKILTKTLLQIVGKKGVYRQDGKVKGWTRPVPDWYLNRLPDPEDSCNKER